VLKEMLSKNHLRRLAIILLVAVVLFAAMAHGGNGLAAAILVPLLFCLDTIICFAAPRIEEYASISLSPVLPVFSPRPPPFIS
jgi:hypothetical protein